jgi:hypothetical protein
VPDPKTFKIGDLRILGVYYPGQGFGNGPTVVVAGDCTQEERLLVEQELSKAMLGPRRGEKIQ